MMTAFKQSKDVFEPRTSTGSEPFSLFICLDANKLVLLSFFSLLKTIYLRVSTKPFPVMQKVHFRLTSVAKKRLLLKLPKLRAPRRSRKWSVTYRIGFVPQISFVPPCGPGENRTGFRSMIIDQITLSVCRTSTLQK